mgnify:FL=1
MSVHWRSIIAEIKATSSGYVLAVSGGLDSMFLLDVFERNLPSAFRVAHFDHGLRDASADEQRFVRNWCASRGVEFHGGRGDPEAMRTASSMEAEARRQRYGFLESLLGPGELVVTAHHANDQIETVIMRLMRGVPEGKLRMRKVEGRRYRPLLGVPRADIERQAKARGLEWMEDASNADLKHERNWVRHVLVPQMMERRNVLKTIGLQSNDGEGVSGRFKP